MSRTQVKLNKMGVRELLKSAGAQEECGRYAREMYGKVSHIEGYEIESRNYPERSGYAILAKDYPAISDNLNNNTLLKISRA